MFYKLLEQWVSSVLFSFTLKQHEDTPLPQLDSHPLFPHLLPILALEKDEVGYSFESRLAVQASSCPLPKHSKYHHIVPVTEL